MSAVKPDMTNGSQLSPADPAGVREADNFYADKSDLEVARHINLALLMCDGISDQNAGFDTVTTLNEAGLAAVAKAIRGVRAALSSHPSAVAVAWRSIDSAPRDGRCILATGGGLLNDVEVVSYNDKIGCWNTESYTLDDFDDEADGYSRPLFWQSLPAPPVPAAEPTRAEIAKVIRSCVGNVGSQDIVAAEAVLRLFGVPAVEPVTPETVSDRYLVWSNEHRCWWRPESKGYTLHVESAGRYSRQEALDISRSSRGGWVKGKAPDEIAIAEQDVLDAYGSPETVKGDRG